MRRLIEPALLFIAFLAVLTGSFAYKSQMESVTDFGHFRWVYDGELTGKWKALQTVEAVAEHMPFALESSPNLSHPEL